ncbi:hypothetical protein GCM10010992_03080 [Cloacibacterium rupense]|uniref:Thioredoxin domain-containing protein n=1 Tax=Cloacibacterium rupense TaxID=517423 RepID=A0ABQ2NGH6_9FLAO|nr:redoxin domain-containing protein [Cloacibacterium rupense]GGP01690.1 hypothetical protein GCM10010992_03080 [Cloacibacterium rupense]
MKKFVFFLTILTSIFLFSQNSVTKIVPSTKSDGYIINIKTQNLAGKTIKLSIYSGSYKQAYRIDSVKVKTNSETISFKQKQKIIPVIYQMAISGKPAKSDILLSNGNVLNFALNTDNANELTTNDALNKSFLEYQKMPASEQKNTALKTLQAKFPQNEALKIFTLFELRKTLKKPNNIDGATFRKSLLNGVNLNDKAIQLMPNAYAFLNNFFSALPIDNENYKSGVDLLLNKQNCESPNFKFYVEWIFKNLELHQTQNINDTAQYVFNQYVNTKSCVELQNSFYNSTFKKLSSFTKLPVGAVLPEFEMKKINGETYRFSDFKNEKVNIVMFYDPLCEHCQTEVPKLTKEIEELEKETNQKIGKLAILNGSSTLWKDFVDKNNLKDWVNVTYKEGDTKTQENLDAFANPKFYILDKNGKIILKTYGYSFVRSQLLK